MAQPTLTGFMISLVLVGFFVGIFGMFYSGLADNYGTDYKNDSLAVYQQLDSIHDEARTYQEDIEEAGADKNIVQQGWDIAGGILSAGITSLKISAQSITVFLRMSDAAVGELSEAGLGRTAILFRGMIGTVVIILIFLGIVLPVILRYGKKI